MGMAIIGLGTEIVECARVRTLIEQHGERFLMRVYTSAEIRWCQTRRNATEQFAALWAAKEAVFKAVGLHGRPGAIWTQVEVEYKQGIPKVTVRGTVKDHLGTVNISSILLTTAFTRHAATATAIATRADS